ncbi:MAG TPA: hypothetical protein VKB81_08500 [Nitrospira sp.]|nr:hypothetical protein [Nitrospira sp.]
MIAVMVRFQYENEFNEARLQQIAEGARSRFQGMPGVAFTVDPTKRQALNFYVWESEDAARKFFSPQTIDGVANIYGVRPSIEYVKLTGLVENPPST